MGDSHCQIKPDPPPCHFDIPTCQTHVWCLNAKKSTTEKCRKEILCFSCSGGRWWVTADCQIKPDRHRGS